MCKRSEASNDPLLTLFLERYQLNLLSVPRANADVGDLYVYDGRRAGSPGQLASFLARPFAMPPIARGEQLAALSGTVSNSVSTEVGLGLLGSFLSGLGAALAIGDVKATWEAKGARAVRFAMESAVRDSVDPGALGSALIGNALNTDHPLVDAKKRYYLVAGVARCAALTIAVENERGQTIDLGAEVTGLGDARVGVSVTRSNTGAVTFAGQAKLAFGVELYELWVRDAKIRLRLPESAMTVRAMERTAARAVPAFLGGADDDVFVSLTTKE